MRTLSSSYRRLKIERHDSIRPRPISKTHSKGEPIFNGQCETRRSHKTQQSGTDAVPPVMLPLRVTNLRVSFTPPIGYEDCTEQGRREIAGFNGGNMYLSADKSVLGLHLWPNEISRWLCCPEAYTLTLHTTRGTFHLQDDSMSRACRCARVCARMWRQAKSYDKDRRPIKWLRSSFLLISPPNLLRPVLAGSTEESPHEITH